MYLYASLVSFVFMNSFGGAVPLEASSEQRSDSSFGPQPGKSSLYSSYRGVEPPFPANHPSPILPTASGEPGPDDVLFQNLLSAEWVIFNFYQKAVETFDQDSFTKAGFPNTTWDSIAEIRDNEAGHLRIFQDSISPTSVKPGPCKYEFGFGKDAQLFLALSTFIEITSMAFLTGLTQQASLQVTKGALTAIASTETRHEIWSLLDIWGASPFSGPSDTSYPYANQILDLTNQFVVGGSCPSANPIYPNPRQSLPRITYATNTTSLLPGSKVHFEFDRQPKFDPGQTYHAVFFHALFNTSVLFNTESNTATIPKDVENKGTVAMVVADEQGAPTAESVVAGPIFFVYDPKSLTLQLP